MKNYCFYSFVLIFFYFNVNSQTQAPGDSNPIVAIEQGAIGNEPDSQSTKLNDLLYSEIFTPKIGTPNSAGFRQVNFSNVGEYTGSTSINVPIYQIQIGQINIPIELNYSSKGIKVDETASNVGQDWSINAGGMVTKVIKGIEDFKVSFRGNPTNFNSNRFSFSQLGTSDMLGTNLTEVGWLLQDKNISLNNYYDITSSTDLVYSLYQIGSTVTKKDLSPDLFYINAPGLNTSFTHKKDGSVMEIAYQGNKIKTTKGKTAIIPFFAEFRDNTKFVQDLRFFDGGPPRRILGINKIEVTNINGTQYLFDQLDVNQYVNRTILTPTIEMESSNDLTSQEIMAYKLSSIKDFKGNEVTFTYDKYAINYPEYRKTSEYEVTNNSGNQSIQNLISTEIRFPNLNRISKINYAEGSVEFKYEEPRKDLPGDYALSKILIKDINNNIIKTIKLEYDYMVSNNNCAEPTCKRLRLLTVQEIGNNDAILPPYRFFYNDDVKLPERGSTITDYLGYANGPVSTEYNNVTSVSCGMCLISPPKLYYSPNKKDFSVSPFLIFSGSFVTQGRSLQPSLAYTKSGVLNKVQYPTGGKEEFEYELNDFHSSLTGQNVQSGGLRISIHKLIDTKGALQVHKYNYLDSKGNSSGILNNLPMLGISHAYSEQLAATYMGLSTYSLQTGLVLHTFTNSRSDFDTVEGSNVGYSRVLIKENADNGYVEKIFSTRKDFPIEQPLFTYKPYDKNQIEFGLNNGWRLPSTNNTELLIGKLKFIRKYDKNNNLVEETKNNHQYDIFDQITDKVGISRKDVFPDYYNAEPIDPDFTFYPSVYSSRNLTNATKTVTKYNQNKVENISSTTYDLKYPLPKAVESIVNESGNTTTLIKQTSYPHDFTTPLMNSLVNANRIAEPILIKTLRKIDQNQEDLSSQQVLYNTFTKGNKTLILPSAVQTIKGVETASNQFEEKIQFHDYDKFGNSIESSKKDDTHTVYLWGNHYSKTIAKIENATYPQVMQALGKSSTETLEYLQNYSEASLKNEIQKIRTNLTDAMVTTYSYKPLVGINNITDPKGISVSYEYDDLNRLKAIKDNDQNILEEYCYGYNGLQSDCQNGTISRLTENDNLTYNADLQIKIGDFKSYKIPITCAGHVNWDNYIPEGAPYKGLARYNLHDKLFFIDPIQLSVHWNPPYVPLGEEYLLLNLPDPTENYTCNYFAERFGHTFEVLGLDSPTFSDGTKEIRWWIEINGKKTELPQLQEYPNVFFIPKCLDDAYGRIACSVKITLPNIREDFGEGGGGTFLYGAKSNLMKFKSGLDIYDRVTPLYLLADADFETVDALCGVFGNTPIATNNPPTQTDPGYWNGTPWTIDNGVVDISDFKISVDNFKMYDIPVPAWLPTTFTWTGLTTPSLHPLFNFPRPIGGMHGENTNFIPHAFPSFITFPYLLDYYTSFYVTKGAYKFNRAAVIQKVENSSDYNFNWYLKIENTGQQIPIIRTLESKDLFFIPPSLNGKRGKLICIATKIFDSAGTPLYFESETITFQQGLSNNDNLNYQVEYLDM
jgi:YD repeat-containing protein